MIREGKSVLSDLLGLLNRGNFLLAVAVMGLLSYASIRVMGLNGLVLLVGGLTGAAILGYFVIFKPEMVFVGWIVAMSCFTYFGLMRLPGVPDFSYPRLMLILVSFVILFGMVSGRPLFTRPMLPDILVLVHALYVLANLKLIGRPDSFHSWYNSSFAATVAYFFAKQMIRSDAQLKALVLSFVAVLFYFGVTAVGEHFEVSQLVWPQAIMDRTIMMPYFGRSRGPFFQPGIFGMMIGMFFLLNVFALTRKHGRLLATALWSNLVLGGLGLLYTFTRGGWVATTMGIIFLSVFRPRFRKLVLVGVLLGFIVTTFGVVNSEKDEVLSKRLENTSTIGNRLGFLASAWRMIKINPMFGIGYFRFLELEPLYNKGTYFPLYGYVPKELGAGVPIHDIYIGRAAEEGLISLGIFLWWLLEVARVFWRKWQLRPRGAWFDRDALATFGAILVAYLLGGMVEDFRYFDNVNVVAYFFAGLIVGFPVRRQVEQSTYSA